jgi:protein-L-isoaspartate(D-aspartate) O-methyltransferase
MNFELARFNMVEQQIRPWEVLDQAVLDLLYAVPREEFVPAAFRKLAFVDMEIPLGEGEFMMAPKMEARVVQELALRKTDRVLEVGTGSGYLTALLARCAAHVFSLEIRPALAAFGRDNLARHGADNVTLEVADGARGDAKRAPYDAIVLTGSTPVLPAGLDEQLAAGGRARTTPSTESTNSERKRSASANISASSGSNTTCSSPSRSRRSMKITPP